MLAKDIEESSPGSLSWAEAASSTIRGFIRSQVGPFSLLPCAWNLSWLCNGFLFHKKAFLAKSQIAEKLPPKQINVAVNRGN